MLDFPIKAGIKFLQLFGNRSDLLFGDKGSDFLRPLIETRSLKGQRLLHLRYYGRCHGLGFERSEPRRDWLFACFAPETDDEDSHEHEYAQNSAADQQAFLVLVDPAVVEQSFFLAFGWRGLYQRNVIQEVG